MIWNRRERISANALNDWIALRRNKCTHISPMPLIRSSWLMSWPRCRILSWMRTCKRFYCNLCILFTSLLLLLPSFCFFIRGSLNSFFYCKPFDGTAVSCFIRCALASQPWFVLLIVSFVSSSTLIMYYSFLLLLLLFSHMLTLFCAISQPHFYRVE